MVITYDEESDAAYWRVSSRPTQPGEAVRQVLLDLGSAELVVDLDVEGQIIGVELIGASAAVEPAVLKQWKMG